MTLSLWHPNAQDQQHLEAQTSRTFARLERRKGFIESAYTSEVKQVWKPTLFMLGEGSTFPRDGEREVYGSMFTDEATRVSLNFKPRINGVALTVGLAA